MTNTLEITEAMAATLQVPLSEAETIEIVTTEPLGPFAPPTVSYLINEGFEGVGAPEFWSDAGYGAAPDFDYAIAPLVGLQSLRLGGAFASVTYNDGATVLNNDEIWIKFRIKTSTIDSATFDVATSGAFYSYISVNMDGTISLGDDTMNPRATTIGAIVSGSIYDFFFHFRSGSGANALVEVSFAAAGDPRPNSGNSYASFSNGGATGNFTLLDMYVGDTSVLVIDSFQVADSDVFAVPATTYSLDGPASGLIGVESDPFTVALVGDTVTGTVTITPDDGSDGTFTPASVELTTASPSATFTYTPVSIGAKTISTTNDGELDDPGSLTYTVAASGLSDGDPITTWEDSSGNGNDATQSGSARPTFKTNIVNGKPVVRFTAAGLSALILSTPISGASPWTVFSVMKPANPAAGSAVSLGSNSTTPIGAWENNASAPPTIVLGAENAYSGVNPNGSVFHVITCRTSPEALHVDGSSITLSFLGGPVSPGNFENIGWRATTLYSDCDIAEVICFNVVVSATNRANIEKYLGTKYGITVAGGSAVQPDTVTGLQGWWKADSLG